NISSRLGSRRDVGARERLEGQEHVHHLLAVARLLHVHDLAAAAIGDAGLRDLAGVDGVVALDVLGPDDTGDDQLAGLEIDADLLLAFDHQVAVRKHLGDDAGDVGLQRFLALHAALAIGGGSGVGGQEAAGQDLVGLGDGLGADEVGNAGVFLVGAAALGLVG